MTIFLKYILIINAIGFILYLINMWLYSNTADGQVDKLLTIVALLFGSGGIVLAILLFDRKALKGNMMSRVFVACIFVIQVVAILFLKGGGSNNILQNVINNFKNNSFWLYYLLIINIITFIAFAIDKLAAIEHKRRLRIVFLLGLAFLGGSIGGLIAMYLLRHKTKKDYFTVGIPLMIVMQVVVLVYFMSR